MAIKLDMEKAYDKLDCDFIKRCFSVLGFNNNWINWIMQCISTTSFDILVNGNHSKIIILERRIRQGDPISLHFALTQPRSDIKIKLNRDCPFILYFMFADG